MSRPAKRRGANGGAMVAGTAFAEAQRHHQAGRLKEAERLYRKVLAADAGHADSCFMLGLLASQDGRHNDAAELIGRAVAQNGTKAAYHSYLGVALQELGRLDEAVAAYGMAIRLKPDYAIAHNNLGNALRRLGRVDEAAASYRRAIELRPDLAEAYNNLGSLLQEMGEGQTDEIMACYAKALALRPDFAEAHANLGLVHQCAGRLNDAAACYRQAIAVRPDFADAYLRQGGLSLERGAMAEAAAMLARAAALAPDEPEIWEAVKRLLSRQYPATPTPEIAAMMLGALHQPTVYAAEIAGSVAGTVRHDPAIAALLSRAEAGEALGRGATLGQGLAAIAANPLLMRLLCVSSVPDPAMERLFTSIRSGLLDSGDLSSSALAAAATLAVQCFINDYAYAQSAEETLGASQLASRVETALEGGQPIRAVDLVALACYRPLVTLVGAERLPRLPWPPALADLVRIQVAEPLAERALVATLPALTGITAGVSQHVRAQYEDNPYPRWVHGAIAAKPLTLARLRRDLGLAPVEVSRPDILVAGCGTGQEAINMASLFPAARVVAVDLSLSSLAYAKRKIIEAGLDNIECYHGDILELGGLDRRFDVVTSSGVLHHMADPLAGWRVLTSLLKADGVMRIGLYSEAARRAIVAVRDLIAARGLASDAEGIRRCRADIMALPADDPMAAVALLHDFFALSVETGVQL